MSAPDACTNGAKAAASSNEREQFVRLFHDELAPFIVSDLANFEQPEYAVDWIKQVCNGYAMLLLS